MFPVMSLAIRLCFSLCCLTEFFRTHTFTTYSASKPPGHQHWVVTSLGRIPRRRPRASYRLMTHADFGREDLGSSRARAAPGAAEAAPPLRALRITVPLPLAHRRAELFHRARPPSRLRRLEPNLLMSLLLTHDPGLNPLAPAQM